MLCSIQMRRPVDISAILILAVGIISCEQIKNKSEQLADKVKEKTEVEFRKKVQKVVDKVYPPFDHDKPNTENNKKRFKDFLKIKITPDIKGIYCFDDAIGIDADYMFVFYCNSISSKQIIKTHNIKIDSINANNGFALQSDFEWWDKERIVSLEKFSWTDGN